MAQEIKVTRLSAVRGDTWEETFPFGGTPESVVFEVTDAAHRTALITKTLLDGVTLVDGGITVTLGANDLTNLPNVLTACYYSIKVYDGQLVETVKQGPLLVYPV